VKVVFVDAFDTIASLPNALTSVVLPNSNTTGSTDDPITPVSDDDTRAFRDTEGLMAIFRTMAIIRDRSPDWAALAAAARDQYASETSSDVNTDLLGAFADGP
jgi:hypothetical protein